MEALPVFSIGCFLAVLEANGLLVKTPIHFSRFFDISGYLAAIILVVMLPVNYNALFGHLHSVNDREDYFLWALLWALVLLAAVIGKGVFKWIFESKPFRFLGNISYSLYLFHLPVLFFVNIWVPEGWKIYAFFGFSLLVACLTYLLIERPMAILKLKYFS